MNGLCASIGFFIVIIVGFGWIIPLIIGIIKRKSAAGIVLIVFSACWFAVICIAAAGLFFVAQSQSARYEVTRFDPDTYDGPVGTIKVSYPAKTVLHLTDEQTGKRISLHSDSNELIAPCGRFKIVSYNGTVDPADGNSWVLNTYISKICYAIVNSNEVVKITFGPALEASISPRKQNENANFEFLLMDSSRNKYSLTRVNKRLPPPEFNVLDSGGTIAWSGSFSYG